MIKLSEMSLFELNETLTIFKTVKQRLGERFVQYGSCLIDESLLNDDQRKILDKYNSIQNVINNVENMIEEKVFNDYVK